jgi:hypothetical protein
MQMELRAIRLRMLLAAAATSCIRSCIHVNLKLSATSILMVQNVNLIFLKMSTCGGIKRIKKV